MIVGFILPYILGDNLYVLNVTYWVLKLNSFFFVFLLKNLIEISFTCDLSFCCCSCQENLIVFINKVYFKLVYWLSFKFIG